MADCQISSCYTVLYWSGVLYVVCLLVLLLAVCKKMKPIPGVRYKYKRPPLIKRLLWDLPKQYAKDIIRRDPEFFTYQGIVIFEGAQGNGKTIGMIDFVRSMQAEYSKAKCLSNLDYKYADKRLDSWDDLIDFKNENGDKKGVIVINDELQNTFNSKQSKDFPMEFVGVVTQNRKNRRILLGTAQNFYMLSKDIRSQCTELRRCFTFFGVLTVILKLVPVIDSDGKVVKMKYRGMYCFVQDDELRDCYDTFEVIKGMKRSGFKKRNDQVSSFSDNQISVDVSASK